MYWTKYKYIKQQRAITSKIFKEVLVHVHYYTALLYSKIHLPMKFQANTSYSFLCYALNTIQVWEVTKGNELLNYVRRIMVLVQCRFCHWELSIPWSMVLILLILLILFYGQTHEGRTKSRLYAHSFGSIKTFKCSIWNVCTCQFSELVWRQ